MAAITTHTHPTTTSPTIPWALSKHRVNFHRPHSVLEYPYNLWSIFRMAKIHIKIAIWSELFLPFGRCVHIVTLYPDMPQTIIWIFSFIYKIGYVKLYFHLQYSERNLNTNCLNCRLIHKSKFFICSFWKIANIVGHIVCTRINSIPSY